MLEFLLRFAWKECVSRNLVSSGREEFVSMIAERDHKDASMGIPLAPVLSFFSCASRFGARSALK